MSGQGVPAACANEDPLYRAWFTTENPRVDASEVDMYTVAYVQNEAALQAERRAELG